MALQNELARIYRGAPLADPELIRDVIHNPIEPEHLSDGTPVLEAVNTETPTDDPNTTPSKRAGRKPRLGRSSQDKGNCQFRGGFGRR